ncbi:MAG: DUF4270 domain-containing protein [Phaeodactylibacter sp.]|nr:DUF4270 domain-containing protein [Phaeodactylibacter sp.]
MRLTFFALVLAVIASAYSCADPTQVGAGLLEEDRADVGFSDTLSIVSSTVANDSIRTYSPFSSSQLGTYLLGNLNDPVFGRSSSSIYAQVYPQSSSPGFGAATVVDSIILVLPYNVDGLYGKTEGEEFGIDVFQLAEVLQENEEYFSSQEAAVEAMPVGSARAMVSTDSLAFTDYDDTDTVAARFPHYRITLDDAVASYLVGLESNIYADDSLFLDAFKGIHLRPTTENEGMLSFRLLSQDAGIYLYYRDSINGKPKRFLYDFDIEPTVRFTNFKHDYDGAPVNGFLDGATEDSIIFIQGMSGVSARLEIPNVANLRGLVVNKAELEFYVADVGGDEAAFTPCPQLILTTPDDEDLQVVVEDISIILSQRRNLAEVFGGTPIEGTSGSPALYRMNISAHFQDIIDGNRKNVLFITPLQKAETASRTILYGASHPQYGIRLKLAFTKL